MDTKDIRLKNAEYLLDKHCAGNKSAFARQIKKTPQMLTKWWLDKNDKERRNIGHTSARLIEQAFGYPTDWLDKEHKEYELEDDPHKKELLKVQQGTTYLPSLLGSALIDTQHQLSIINNKKGKLMIFSTDGEAYGFQFLGHNPNPILSNGWGLIVEPNTPLTVDEFALIRLKTGEILLRTVAYLGNDEIIVRHPVTGDQSRLLRSQVERAEYCYVGTPPSKIVAEPI